MQLAAAQAYNNSVEWHEEANVNVYHLEMGNGLLMNIIDQKTKDSVVFNQYKIFTTYVPGQSSTIATRDYQAELTQQPGESLRFGPFQKDLIVKINYH